MGEKFLVCSHIGPKNAVSAIRVRNPYTAFAERFPNVFYFDIPIVPLQNDVMKDCNAIVFCGRANPYTLKWLEYIRAKNLAPKMKIVVDEDDLIWDNMLPEWNLCKPTFDGMSEEEKKGNGTFLRLADRVTFSTEFLRDWTVDKFGLEKGKSRIIPNAVSKTIWVRGEQREWKGRKPVVMYSGSPTHYSNKKRMLGDFSQNIADWLIENAKEGKIELHVLGGFPWFFEEIKSKVKTHGWVSYSALPGLIRSIKPDFSVNPLAECDFNRAKSDIKLVEAAAMGCICVGSKFDGSPYKDCLFGFDEGTSKKKLDDIFFGIANDKDFSSAVAKQDKWMEKNGRWLESVYHLARLADALGLKLEVTKK